MSIDSAGRNSREWVSVYVNIRGVFGYIVTSLHQLISVELPVSGWIFLTYGFGGIDHTRGLLDVLT